MFGQSIQSAALNGRLYVFICLSQIKILKFMNLSGQMFARAWLYPKKKTSKTYNKKKPKKEKKSESCNVHLAEGGVAGCNGTCLKRNLASAPPSDPDVAQMINNPRKSLALPHLRHCSSGRCKSHVTARHLTFVLSEWLKSTGELLPGSRFSTLGSESWVLA